MRLGSVAPLLLGVVIAIAPAGSSAAERHGYNVAFGSYDAAELCGDLPGCSVLENDVI